MEVAVLAAPDRLSHVAIEADRCIHHFLRSLSLVIVDEYVRVVGNVPAAHYGNLSLADRTDQWKGSFGKVPAIADYGPDLIIIRNVHGLDGVKPTHIVTAAAK